MAAKKKTKPTRKNKNKYSGKSLAEIEKKKPSKKARTKSTQKSKTSKSKGKNHKQSKKLNLSKHKQKVKTKIKPIKKRFFGLPKWLRWILLCLILGLIIGLVIAILYLRDLPSPRSLSSQEIPVSTIITDRNGEILYEIYADANRNPVDLEDMPDHLIWATIAIEDKNFYQHWGFSIQGITRALSRNLFSGSLQGGSTITQQLVKVGLLTPERTWQRKIKEAFLTIGTELLYTKDEILEMYLNYIPYGGTAWGIDAAAKTYFDKSVSELTLAESALLAGLPAAPTRFSPFGTRPELAQARQEEVLRRMAEDGYISLEEAEAAMREELDFATDSISIRAPHFALFIKDLLIDKYGANKVERGGLRVRTSLDLQLQEVFEASVAAEIAQLEQSRVGNGAALVTKPKTGEILAMVGSKNYFDTANDGQVNITTRRRQPGSSIKPINYLIGFQLKNFSPGTVWLDIPTCFQVTGQAPYCPRNYDGSFRGPVTTRQALANSYNIPAVKALAVNELDTFVATASAMGIQSFQDPSNYGLSLTLGGGEVTMLEMATAFGTIANQGVTVPLQPILSVTDWQGNVYQEYRPDEVLDWQDQFLNDPELQAVGANQLLEFGDLNLKLTRSIQRQPAYLISDIMSDNQARAPAFGTRSELYIPDHQVAAKTGTTNNLRDNWTIGFTPEYLTAVWVGNNDNSPMNPNVVSGVTGAAPIFNDIMSFLLAEVEPVEFQEPPDIVTRPICRNSGLVSNPDNPCETISEIFWSGTEPGVFDNSYREIWVKADTGFEPEEGDTENLKLERHLVLSDLTTRDYCLDCPRPLDEDGEPIREVDRVVYPLTNRQTRDE